MEDLGALPGGGRADALSVNLDGTVIAGKCEIAPNVFRAFLWTPQTGIVDLNEYLPSRGTNISGWVLEVASSVSADGSAIAGSGLFNGQPRAWLATGLTGSRFAPTTEIIDRGAPIAGDTDSYAFVDSDRRVFRPGVTLSTALAPIQVVVESHVATAIPSSLRVIFTSNSQIGNVTERIEVWDFTASHYLIVRNATAAVGQDGMSVIEVPGSSDYYVGPNNTVRVRYSFKASGPVLVYPYQVRINQVIVETTP
jgi:probable HAF family extracellular repeat protein